MSPLSKTDRESTVGIQCDRWACKRSDTPKHGPVITFYTWDFAGQVMCIAVDIYVHVQCTWICTSIIVSCSRMPFFVGRMWSCVDCVHVSLPLRRNTTSLTSASSPTGPSIFWCGMLKMTSVELRASQYGYRTYRWGMYLTVCYVCIQIFLSDYFTQHW